MKIIFGLGNPGEKYKKTRHNLGFMILDRLAEKFSVNFEKNSKFNAETAEVKNDSEKIVLVKPSTFMNNSGQAVQAIMSFFKVSPQDILVVHDEIDLTFGKIKIATDSGPAGHKGVSSIIESLGTKDFKRIRFGVQNENKTLPTEVFVLKNFSKEELAFIASLDLEELFEGFI